MTAKLNTELAYQVLDHIDAHPEAWQQGLYIGKTECGTAGCFAGWAVMLSGAKPFGFRLGFDGGKSTDLVTFEGGSYSVSELAQKLLGASRYVRDDDGEEEDLFESWNSREDLGRLVAEMFGPRPGGES